MNLNEIIKKIENFAPPELACVWDNSGWQVYLGKNSVNKILLALTVTYSVLEQAIKNNCDLIISHHPLIFEKLNKISAENQRDSVLIKAIQNNIHIYSAHTNLDASQGGVADKLAAVLGLQNIRIPENLSEEANLVRIGELEEAKNIDLFINELKEVLKTDKVRLINPLNKTKILKVAVVPGSGASFIAKIEDVDVLVTGDLKYHNALDVENFAVIDAGHLETERIILPFLKEILSEFGVEVLIAEELSPWEFL